MLAKRAKLTLLNAGHSALILRETLSVNAQLLGLDRRQLMEGRDLLSEGGRSQKLGQQAPIEAPELGEQKSALGGGVESDRAWAQNRIATSLKAWRSAKPDGAQHEHEGVEVSQPHEAAEVEADKTADHVADVLHGGAGEAGAKDSAAAPVHAAPPVAAKLKPGTVSLAKNDKKGTAAPAGNRAGAKKYNPGDSAVRAKMVKANARAAEIQSAVPAAQQGRVTMAVGITGSGTIYVGTSEPNGYLRPGVEKALGGATVVKGNLHAERNICAEASDLVAVGAGRPICEICEDAILRVNAIPASPCRSGKTYV